jgi:predicted acyltransferase (DUF342 family)
MKDVGAVMCSEPLCIAPERVVDADVYTDGSLEVGQRAALRAAFAAGEVTMRSDSTILRWLHAHRGIYVDSGSACYGRLSAAQFIHLAGGVSFQRVYAPQILTVSADLQEPLEAGDANIPSVEVTDEPGPQRIRAHGDFTLPRGESLHANVIATGELRFERNTRFLGSAKSRVDTVIEDGACVHGSLVSGRDIRIGGGCFVAGPLLAENDVVIGPGTRIGRIDGLTTIAARHVTIAPGCQLHGSVWARVQGTVQG